jgi:hypothetical protein
MFLTTLLPLALTLTLTTATLQPAISNSKGFYPSNPGCSPSATSNAIQAAECSHNTRTHETQTFAIFKTDHQYDSVYGAPYGTCEAYACAAPTSADEMTADADYWTFFWGDGGESDGEGAGCIRDPNSGICGCESSSDGKFVAGKTDCV